MRAARNCKGALEDLWRASERCGEPPALIWGEIARQVDAARASHRRETGLEAFLAEVRRELGPLATDQQPG